MFGIQPVPQTPRVFPNCGNTYMRERELCQSALTTRRSTAPLPPTRRHADADGTSQRQEPVHARRPRETAATIVRHEARRTALIKQLFFSTRTTFLFEPVHSTILSTLKHWSFEPDRGRSNSDMAMPKKFPSIFYVHSRVA